MQTEKTVLPSSVSLSKSTVYALQKDIYALDLSSGKLRRSYQMQTLGRPTIMDEMIYTSYLYTNRVHAFHVFDGSQRWFTEVVGKLSSSPAVVNDVIYVSTLEGYICALQASSGILLWQYEAEPTLLVSPTVVNGVLYIAPVSSAPSIYALYAETGSLLWRSSITTASSLPLTVSNNLISITAHTTCTTFQSSDGSVVWQQELGGQADSSPVVVGEKMYISCHETKRNFPTGEFTSPELQSKAFISALRVSDGHILWQQHLETDARSLTFPVIADNRVYFGSDDGSLYALAEDSGTLLWRYKTGGTLLSSPALVGAGVYIGSNDGNIYALNADNGSLRWRTFIGDDFTIVGADIEAEKN
jgi:eukaryotic-like serine/threonine-protein kinase